MEQYQKQRFELKYRIDRRLVEPLRHFLASCLDLDRHSAVRPDLAYPVHSLYLDSPDMRLFQATVNGDRNRYKLRVRYYTGEPEDPAFFEIKARRDRIIRKHRAMVRRSSLPDLLDGRPPAASDLCEYCPSQLEALVQFCAHRDGLQAEPRTHVGYRREAWLSPDNSVRVTMDRQVGSEVELEARLNARLSGLTPVFGRLVVLEIKFTDRYPRWLAEMVRAFGLRQSGAAKYVGGVIRLGEHLFLSCPARNEVRRRLMLERSDTHTGLPVSRRRASEGAFMHG